MNTTFVSRLTAAAVTATLALGFGAQAARADDIVETAMKNPQFSTLVTAVKAAGLVNTLKGAGPFTVFAPTNAAFAKIPPAKLKALLADKKALTAVLTYHVLSGEVMAADVVKMKNGSMAKTVQGSSLTVKTSPAVMVNNAKVIKTDIKCDNGVIHVIDTVLMPKMTGSKMMGAKMGKPMMAKPGM